MPKDVDTSAFPVLAILNTVALRILLGMKAPKTFWAFGCALKGSAFA
jgi:hypothetical protein